MWIKIDVDTDLTEWKPPEVDEWITVTENNTAQVSAETGSVLIENRDFVTKT